MLSRLDADKARITRILRRKMFSVNRMDWRLNTSSREGATIQLSCSSWAQQSSPERSLASAKLGKG